MLKVVEKSKAFKTTDCAITYRAGDDDIFGTCPKLCPLNPNQTVSTVQIDWDYLDAVLDATVRGGRSWTYSHFKFEDISFKQNKRFHLNFLYISLLATFPSHAECFHLTFTVKFLISFISVS